MSLATGAQVGRYEVVSVLGSGGMGEVYRARDRKLQRDVALKILPAAFAADPDRLARFEREALVLASLNHPNIAHIYGLEESDGVNALALELVEGVTLAERIARGRLPLREASDIARQIAAAVEAAHDAGVVHRDLKPANIKVRTDGTVKVLDFGLAKVSGAEGAITHVGPETTHLRGGGDTPPTAPGMVVGTAAYMAPEQARGKAVDKRADIWAFGCVFAEMLTGRQLFSGDTISDTLAAVLTGAIDLSDLPPALPGAARRMLRRCLDRDPKTRLRDIGEVRVALDAATAPTASTSGDASRAVAGHRQSVAWSVAALLGIACVALTVQWRRATLARSPSAPAYRFQIATPTMLDLADFELSPDGRTLAFVALSDAQAPSVWIRPLDAAQATVLAGTEGATRVFWSPDSQTVGYAANRQLHRRPIQSAASQPIAAFTGQFVGGAWSGDTIVFASFPNGLMRVSASGGAPAPLTRLRSGERLHGRPVFLPDGRRLLFPADTDAGSQTCLVSLDDPTTRCADAAGALVASLDPQRILSLRDGSLLVQPFDLATMRASGDATPAAIDELQLRTTGNRAAVSYSPAGAIAFRPGAGEQARLVWFDREGRRGEAVATGSYDTFDLSPDGHRVLAAGTDPDGNDVVSLIDVRRGVVSRVVAGERGWANDPVWSPDGREFAYTQRSDRSRIVARPVDGGGPERTLFEPPDSDVWVEDWSRDGREVAVGASRGWRSPRLLLVPTTGGAPRTVIAESGIVDEYHFSPDGHWLAYNSDASGRVEVYLTPLPPTGERWQVSSAGGVQPRWRRDGRELFYIAPDSALMAVAIGDGRAFNASAPRRLFALPQGLGSPILDEYAVAADGASFLVAEPIRARGVQPITVIVNWPARGR
jgi:Tol biopolymer transport system component